MQKIIDHENLAIDDQHPVILICGRDLVEILRKAGIKSQLEIIDWLSALNAKT